MDDEDRETEILREMSTKKVRWGAVSLPATLAQHILIEDGQVVRHLSFAGESDDVQEPEEGQLYA